ncbi:MAG: hemolysin family protein [Phycisphaeraceae bacterium]
MPHLLMLLLLPVLLVASAFFSGSETALFSLPRHTRAQFARSAALVPHTITRLLAETRGLLITLLLGNMTINVLFFVVSSILLIDLSRVAAAREGVLASVAVAGLTVVPPLVLILLGEVLPKLIAARLPVQWSRTVALPLMLCHRGIAPIRVGASWLVITPLARLIAPPKSPPALSAGELENLLTLSQRHGVIDLDEERLLQQVLDLNELKVRDLMVPRVDVQAFDLERAGDSAARPADLIDLIKRTHLRHIPVYRGDLDTIVGIVYARQILLHRPATIDELLPYVRQVRFVPEQQRADTLLRELRRTGTAFAVVVDEYGGTAGIVTIEDVVEHLVGDIAGDYEADTTPPLESVSPGVWRVGANLPVHEWASLFGGTAATLGLTQRETISTIAGLVMAGLGRLPEVGDQVRLGNVLITVEAMAGRRVDRVLVQLAPPDDASAEGAPINDPPEGTP